MLTNLVDSTVVVRTRALYVTGTLIEYEVSPYFEVVARVGAQVFGRAVFTAEEVEKIEPPGIPMPIFNTIWLKV